MLQWLIMFDFTLNAGSRKTRVVIGPNALLEVGSLLAQISQANPSRHVAVVADRRVGALHGDRLISSLSRAGNRVCEYRIDPGEGSKNLSTLGELYHFLKAQEIGRDAVVVALGGGVVSDLAGLAAATWMRGIDWVVCPTTMEADLDACLGGKTAIDLPGGKNLVGAFHHPILVVVDPTCLATLEPRDVRAGLAESIKHALIDSSDFLTWQEAHASSILALDQAVTTDLILRNLQIKAGVVERDPQEHTGARMMLNFGHTIGHAIEDCCGYDLRHGECVSLGIVAACRLSQALNLLNAKVVERVEALLVLFGLPTRLDRPIEFKRIEATLQCDKKARGGSPQFVLLEGIGKPVVRGDVPRDAVRRAYESLLAK